MASFLVRKGEKRRLFEKGDENRAAASIPVQIPVSKHTQPQVPVVFIIFFFSLESFNVSMSKRYDKASVNENILLRFGEMRTNEAFENAL